MVAGGMKAMPLTLSDDSVASQQESKQNFASRVLHDGLKKGKTKTIEKVDPNAASPSPLEATSLSSASDSLEPGKAIFGSKRSPAGISGLFGAALRDLKKVKQQDIRVATTDG